MNRTTRTLIACGVMSGCFLLAACGNPDPYSISHGEPPSGRYRLEILNNADDSVRMQVDMWAQFRWNSDEDGPNFSDLSGIFDLSAGKTRTFFMDSPFAGSITERENNRLVSGFSAIMFYDKESDVPYARYVYQGTVGCGEGVNCGNLDGDELDRALVYYRTNGQEERLFVKDPERPFYLERDREDRGLGRIVITFVPTADTVGARQR